MLTLPQPQRGEHGGDSGKKNTIKEGGRHHGVSFCWGLGQPLSSVIFFSTIFSSKQRKGWVLFASSHMTKCCALLLAQPGCHVKEGKNGQKATLGWPTPTYFLNPVQDGTGQHKAPLGAKVVIWKSMSSPLVPLRLLLQCRISFSPVPSGFQQLFWLWPTGKNGNFTAAQC